MGIVNFNTGCSKHTCGRLNRLGIKRNDREKIERQLKISGAVVERMTNTMAEFYPQIS